MKNNIIAKIGSAISRNREQAKLILDKHKISYGAGKNSDIILAAFKAIKAGNIELALDLSGLIQLEKGKKTGTPVQTLLAGIKAKIDAVKAKRSPVVETNTGATVIDAAAVTSNAEGDIDTLATDAADLADTITAGDPEALAKEAEQDQMHKTILYVLGLVAAALLVFWAIKTYWK